MDEQLRIRWKIHVQELDSYGLPSLSFEEFIEQLIEQGMEKEND